MLQVSTPPQTTRQVFGRVSFPNGPSAMHTAPPALRYNATGRRTHSLLRLGVARRNPSAGETLDKAVSAKLRSGP